jgi:hypothetical protein
LILNDLINFTKQLEKFDIEYALGGSGLLYSLNFIDEVNDWDITTDCPYDELVRALSNFEWEQSTSGDYPFASKYRLSISNPNIDIIGYFGIHTEMGIFKFPTTTSFIWNEIKVGSPESWFVAYTLMGRTTKANLPRK